MGVMNLGPRTSNLDPESPMTVDKQKLRNLIASPVKHGTLTELRRADKIFFIGGELPAKETLESLFDSYCQAPAELFCLSFSDLNNFHCGEELARLVKKNFNAHIFGRIDYPAPPYIIERAYAAGVDILDIPLRVFDQGLARERGLEKEERLKALEYARTVFPRWSVTSTLAAGEEPSCSTVSGIDTLLAAGIVPLVEVSARAVHYPADEMGAIFEHLAEGWRKRKVSIKPLLPLLDLITPLAAHARKGVLRGFIEKVYDRKLLAASDLRRNLRVRQIEESFESAGL
ncbi:MAG: hypothetical protein FD174_1951 [Geobacteraceae bacterium]|nr:MAG: hypothetical protein FD174_1951 [Geobacteraceae bacterium]